MKNVTWMSLINYGKAKLDFFFGLDYEATIMPRPMTYLSDSYEKEWSLERNLPLKGTYRYFLCKKTIAGF